MTTLLDYHRLRDSEVKSWNLAALEEAVRSQNPTFPERVKALLPEPEEKFSGDRLTIQRCPLHSKLTELCELYLSSTPEQRTFIRTRIDKRLGGKMQGFGFRAAVLGARQKSEHTIRLGLVAHAIEDLATGDVRDNLCLLTVLFNAAKRFGSDPAVLFQEVAGMAGPAMSAVLRDYLNRHPDLQTLEMMGFREVETPDGVYYQQATIKFRNPRK